MREGGNSEEKDWSLGAGFDSPHSYYPDGGIGEKMCEPFTVEDMEIIFYAAQTALADAETFDNIAKHFDIFDDDMFKLRERLYVNHFDAAREANDGNRD